MRFDTTAVTIEPPRTLYVSIQRVGSDDVSRTPQSAGLHSCGVSGSSWVKISGWNQVILILAVFRGPSWIQTNIQAAEHEMIPAGVGMSGAVRSMFTVEALDDCYCWE
jgi:hypothetical protein